MRVTSSDGAVLGHVLPVNGHWAYWRGAAPAPLRWADTREQAILALTTLPIGRREMPEQRNPVDRRDYVSLPARRRGASTGGTNDPV